MSTLSAICRTRPFPRLCRRRFEYFGRFAAKDGSVEVIGFNRNKIVLLAVPADTESHQAHDIMMAAAAPDNASTIEGLLATRTPNGEARASTVAVE